MKVFAIVAALGLLASEVVAAGPQACQPGKCIRALQAAGTQRSCVAYMEKTVIPCPTTVTHTSTTTVTKPTTKTQTRNVIATSTKTIINPVTSTVTTVVDKVTVSFPTEVSATSTLVIPVTITTGVFAADKRAEKCHPVTKSSTTLPLYARTACSGLAQFSSACACAGIPTYTVTEKQVTATEVVKRTVTAVPMVTVTKVQTSTKVVTTIKKSIVPATLVTTATVSVPSVHTDLSIVSVTSTTAVPPPPCTTFVVVASGDNTIGYFRTVRASTLQLTPDSTLASRYRLDGTTLYPIDDVLQRPMCGANTADDSSTIQPVSGSPDWIPMTCSVTKVGVSKFLSCSSMSTLGVNRNIFQATTGTTKYVEIGTAAIAEQFNLVQLTQLEMISACH